MAGNGGEVRAVALVGPGGAGKTSLAEALLSATGAATRPGSVDAGTSVGDASPEARARRATTEANIAELSFLGDRFVIVDLPGSVHFSTDNDLFLPAADLALVVVDPDHKRAELVQPILRQLEALGVPHAIFVNKIDQARGRIRDLLAALEPMSKAALVARQIPIREGEAVTGFVDLALERAFAYGPAGPSKRIELPAGLAAREHEARFHMLEQLADHDDALLEALVSDLEPPAEMVFGDLTRELADGVIVPVFFGSATSGWGVRRLLKALRHETPRPAAAAERLGVAGSAVVLKVSHASQMGRLALVRNFGASLSEGAIFGLQGAEVSKVREAAPGAIVALAKVEAAVGERVGGAAAALPGVARPRASALAIETRDRKDDVRLSGALAKILEEDPALAWEQEPATGEMLLKGVSDEHLRLALDRLKRRYGVAVETRRPRVGHRETIRRGTTQRGRHKKQSGGHGQFADVVIEVAPLARGEGFRFGERITGGAVPKQWIPAVETGVRDALEAGPLGFPVVDVAVTLTDGGFHSVDSSELAFRIAGRLAMGEALKVCEPLLLEPVAKMAVLTPSFATSRLTSAIAGRRGQILGFEPREGWHGWDRVEAMLPQAELSELGAEVLSLSQGLASFEAQFDHLAELNGRLADEVVSRARAA